MQILWQLFVLGICLKRPSRVSLYDVCMYVRVPYVFVF